MTTTTDLTIRPFNVHVPDEDLADLRRRITATRLPSKELVADRSQGVQLATIQELARYWTTEYDGRAAADHDARLARVGDRNAWGRRPADGTDGAWRTRRGRVRLGAAVAARLRLLRRAGRGRLEPRSRRARLGGADAPPRLHPLRRPGRRRGRLDH